jgi:outer membrane protein assembly factor BamE (lipoprotein component of BamABCDE complex)
MTFPKSAVLATVLLGAVAVSGCAKEQLRQGYVADQVLVASVQPGVDTRDSVVDTLGHPSFVGQAGDSDWYYVSRQTRNYAFQIPHPSDQTVLHIRFDQAGNVAEVNRIGMEFVANVSPHGDKTPTMGRKRSFFEELFGNIGAMGGSQGAASTLDNPQ